MVAICSVGHGPGNRSAVIRFLGFLCKPCPQTHICIHFGSRSPVEQICYGPAKRQIYACPTAEDRLIWGCATVCMGWHCRRQKGPVLRVLFVSLCRRTLCDSGGCDMGVAAIPHLASCATHAEHRTQDGTWQQSTKNWGCNWNWNHGFKPAAKPSTKKCVLGFSLDTTDQPTNSG